MLERWGRRSQVRTPVRWRVKTRHADPTWNPALDIYRGVLTSSFANAASRASYKWADWICPEAYCSARQIMKAAASFSAVCSPATPNRLMRTMHNMNSLLVPSSTFSTWYRASKGARSARLRESEYTFKLLRVCPRLFLARAGVLPKTRPGGIDEVVLNSARSHKLRPA